MTITANPTGGVNQHPRPSGHYITMNNSLTVLALFVLTLALMPVVAHSYPLWAIVIACLDVLALILLGIGKLLDLIAHKIDKTASNAR